VKVGHFVSFGLGGADRTALNILIGLKDLGLDCSIFFNEFSIPRKMPGIHNTGYTPISRQPQFDEISKTIKINGYTDLHKYNLDILHTHRSGEDTWLIPGFDSTKHPYKIIETNFHGSRGTKADIRAYPNNTLCAVKGIRVDKYNRIIPNAILPPLTSDDMRVELGLVGKTVFGRIARPDSDIYSPLNLEAYAKIQNDSTAFVYVAPHESAYADAERFGVRSIIWIPPLTDSEKISKIYNTFDILLHSNKAGETFGNTVAEAMIHGVPVISHTGSPTWPQAHVELFGEHKRFVISGYNADAYAAAITEVMSNMALRKLLGEYFKNRAYSMYNPKEVARQYLNLYHDVIYG